MIERLKSGSKKLFHRAIWTGLSWRAKPPHVEVLYQNNTDGTVLCVHGPAYIEPEAGYIISNDGFLLENSLLDHTSATARPFKSSVPSPFRFWRTQQHPENAMVIPEVLSFRNFAEWNYYHFYFDVLCKFDLLHVAGVDTDLPIALAKYVDDVPFVRPLIGRGAFARHQWVNPHEKYIHAEKIIYCQTNRPFKNRISYLYQALRVERRSSVGTERIFLNRAGSRYLSNLEELLPILKAHRFHIVDTANMSIDEQIAIFANVRYLIAIHGAGTTNILFRGEYPLGVLELHSDRYMYFFHRQMCEEMGYRWDHLEGKAEQGVKASLANFCVCKEALELKIRELLSH